MNKSAPINKVDSQDDAPNCAIPPEAPSLTLRENFSWVLAGNLVNAGCQFVLLIVLARWGSKETVGRFALATAIAAPIMTLSMLHLRALLATDVRAEYRLGDFVALRLLTTIAGWSLIIVVAGATGYSVETIYLIGTVGLIYAADALSDLLHGVFQRCERLDYAGVALVCKGPLGLLLVTVSMGLDSSLPRAVLALAISRWLILLSYELPQARRLSNTNSGGSGLSPAWCVRHIIRLAIAASPLGITVFLISLRANMPRYLLEQHGGAGALGLFAGIIAMTQIGTPVVRAMTLAATPRLAHLHSSEKTSDFLWLTWKLSLFGALIGLTGLSASLLAGETILVMIYGAEFGQGSSILIILMGAATIAYASAPFGCAATASRRIRMQPLIHSANLILTAVIAWWAISWGLTALALAIFLSTLFGALLFLALLFTTPDAKDENANEYSQSHQTFRCPHSRSVKQRRTEMPLAAHGLKLPSEEKKTNIAPHIPC